MTDPLLHAFGVPGTDESWYRSIVRGEGVWVWDAAGNRYLDGMASLWLCQVGHGRREIADAVHRTLLDLGSYHVFPPFTNEQARAAASAIVSRSPIDDGRVLFGVSGSDAVDQAAKLARRWATLDDPDRTVLIHRTRGYHGTNLGGTALQGIPGNRSGWGPLLSDTVEVAADDLDALAGVFEAHRGRVAAVITEPVQGAGGVWPPVDGYLAGVRRLCDEHGALLIFDEVICGFGRLGHWFGSERYGVVPDMAIFAKGVTSGYQPLSGVIVGQRVRDRLEPGPVLATGTTYSGHPAACAAALANLAIIDDEGLLGAADRIGAFLSPALASMEADGLIDSYRGVAGIWAVDIGREARPTRNALLDGGLILRPLGNALAICPPLVIADDELGQLVETLRSVLTRA